jgi:hypothetical protein
MIGGVAIDKIKVWVYNRGRRIRRVCSLIIYKGEFGW